ncbi:conserved hypothetical protein [Cupriavidus taiwanensis]|uniref:PoNe immunity protein domain-containing protein n=1 Tax=Cupriavidus taiwanensis TaxID=164546 RepID=UPI000E13D956|nr:PoNe immunity protein domain-containing protein [Cupriavidus taiwanensis]SPA01348.1 conserved hypothetical protein [Cupriavidus taiwanensis]
MTEMTGRPAAFPATTANSGARLRQPLLYEALYLNARSELLEGIDACRTSIRTENLNPYYLVCTQGSIFSHYLWLWMLEYTAGADINELANGFGLVADEFVRWNELNIRFRIFLREKFKDRGDTDLAVSAVDFNNRVEYQEAIHLISIAILLHDRRSIRRIIAAMQNRHEDALYEQLIADYVSGPQDGMDEVVFDKPYATLVEPYFQEEKGIALWHVNDYVDKWYRFQDGARWYNAHKKIENDRAFYYGYWVFEAGATSYLLDLDDSGINHRMYPKDLVAYARRLRDANLVTTDFDTPTGVTE